MATISLRGNTIHSVGELPAVGDPAPRFTLTESKELGDLTLDSLRGSRTVLNIFPSIDTPTCAQSVRRFNELAAAMPNTKVVCVAADLPFAMNRFCGAEGIDNVVTASTFRSSFADDYGVRLVDGRLAGLCARAVVVLDDKGVVIHTELVPEIGQEPNYDAVLAALA